ncbi:hypothetical protein DLD99_08480 [Pseudomonas kribbensis]|uniref:Uncharacterized protein n=1 Tax=Pseudomonas kribbensis TaxID=1628086 RepID=A0A345RMJ2_9PSED|nr:hypothetical protein DLD99_08480 [Pseudomonas kribbensis]
MLCQKCRREGSGAQQNNVGASLLAIATWQSTSMLTIRTPSPAGWLPQFFQCRIRRNSRRRWSRSREL